VDNLEEFERERGRLSQVQKKVFLAPPRSISLMTDFETVYLLPNSYLRLKTPKVPQPAANDVHNRSPIGDTCSGSDVSSEDGEASISDYQSIESEDGGTVTLTSPSGAAISYTKQEKEPARSAADSKYKQYPDHELDSGLREASFVNLITSYSYAALELRRF
jgi:hypothetical protein